MKINIFEVKDDLEGNWWHHIHSSNFGFLGKIPNLKDHEVKVDDILIHKEIKEGENFPTIRYHLIIEDGTMLVKNDEVKEVLARKLVNYVQKNGKFPFACSLAKIFQNGNAQVNYKPTQFESFALKIVPNLHGIEDTDQFFNNLGTIRSNPIQDSKLESRPAKQWVIESSSDPTWKYTVSRDGDGSWSCTCPHWSFRKTECKHIKQCKSKK